MEAYTILAKYYDVLMQDFDYQSYLDFIKSYTKGEGVDLCCGTGSMTIMLSKLGNKMIGVDLSQEMLNTARDKARLNFQNITFINSDIFDVEFSHQVDFMTCVCDGINYIEKKKLKKIFENISNNIKKDGYFIFDISSEYKLKKIIGNNIFCEDSENATYIWSNELKKDHVNMSLAFFEKEKDNLYKRIDEEHTQYFHKLQDLLELLCEFDVKVFDGVNFNKVKNSTRRLLFICRKK